MNAVAATLSLRFGETADVGEDGTTGFFPRPPGPSIIWGLAATPLK